MSKKKRLKKREIKEDQLVTTALKVSNFVQERFTQVIAGVVVLLAVVAIVLFTAQGRRNSAESAEREFAVAMNQFQTGQVELAGTAFATMADQYSGQRIGRVSMYFLGQTRLAQLRYPEAIEAYDRYLSKAGSKGDFSQSARIAKGYCYEGLRQYRQAGDHMAGVASEMDPSDGRYYDVLFTTGMFYKEAGDLDKAADYFEEVSDGATGPLRDRAAVWVSLVQ